MSPTAPSKAISIRVTALTRATAGGQRRHDLRQGFQPEYVDASRSADNRILIQPPTPTELRQRTIERRQMLNPARALKSNAAIAVSGIVTFGTGAQRLVNAAPAKVQDRLYRRVAEAIGQRYGAQVLGLVVHADEAAPHAHVVWDARTAAGHSLTRSMSGRELQTIAALAAAEVIPGIERGVSKRLRVEAGEPTAAWVNRSVRELHRDLPAERAALEATLEVARAKEATLEARIAKLEARQTELTARETKRLVVYTRRLTASQAEVVKMETILAEKNAELGAVGARIAAAAKRHQELEAQRMSPGSLLTGGLRRRETELLEQKAALTARETTISQGEQDLHIRQQETVAADRRRNHEHWKQVEAREFACEAIAGELVRPDQKPGQWQRGARYDPDTWNATRREFPIRWQATIWEDLRRFAAACLQPIRRLRRRQEIALDLARTRGAAEIVRVLDPPAPAARPQDPKPVALDGNPSPKASFGP